LAIVGAVRVQPASSWKIYPIDLAPAALVPAIARADAVFKSLDTTVIAELSAEVHKHGFGGALDTCEQAAADVARRVAREQGFPIGRTSSRLRNQSNSPRPWAAPIVDQYAGKRAAAASGFAVDLGNRIGLLRPITTVGVCVGCHGPSERLDANVRAILKKRYPTDRAVGFAAGDLRGWMWAEIPKAR
jgi:hypothetical protein